jgi:hypothetical protein
MRQVALHQIGVKSPCEASWKAMKGGGAVRHCAECDRKVYDLSAMSRRQAEALLAGAEGRLCVRFYRNADGTIHTENCPQGWQSLTRRAVILVGSLAGLAARAVASGSAVLKGVITDPAGSVVEGAAIVVTNVKTGTKGHATSGGDGSYLLAVEPGTYEFHVEAPGFRMFSRAALIVRGSSPYTQNVTLYVGVSGEVVDVGDSAKPAKSASLSGVVTDPSGAVVPKATVALTGAKAPAAILTAADGAYRFTDLRPGLYTVRIAAPGFAPFEKLATIQAGHPVTMDASLQVAAKGESVVVGPSTAQPKKSLWRKLTSICTRP